MALLAFATLMICAPLALAGETISLAPGSAGCVAEPPGAPTAVKATPKDGRLILSWSPPADGSCVQTYVVNVLDPDMRSGIPVQTSSTDADNTTVLGLENNKTYRIQIQAYSDQFQGGGTAEVTSAPSSSCNSNLAPGSPLNLRAQPGDGMVQVCWDGVTNDACVDNWSVSAVKQSQSNFKSSVDGQLTQGACTNVTGLQSGTAYVFTVTPISTGMGPGMSGTVTATPGSSAQSSMLAGWTCKPIQGCRPGSATFCAFSGCQAVYKLGGCRGPLMFDVDHSNKQVSQWCSEVCTCDISMASVFTPMSWGFQAVDSLLGGQLPLQVASSLSSSNPRLSSVLQQLGTFTGGSPSAGGSAPAPAPAPSGGEAAPFAGGGTIATLLQKAVTSGKIGEVQGSVAGAVSGAVASSVVSSAVQGASNTANALFQAGVSALQQGSGGALGSTAATVASTLQQAGGRFSGSAGKVAGAVTSAVTSDLVSNTVNGMLQGGANRLTQLLSGGGGPVSAFGGGP